MITSGSNAKVKQVVRWKDKAGERREAGIFLTEGFKLFQEAPADSIREVYLSEDAAERAAADPELWNKLQRIGWETVSGEVFQKMSDTRTPQGILCVVKRPVYTLDGLLAESKPLLTVLDGIQDPGNLGTIVRTGEGAGVTGVIMGNGTVDIFNPKTIRATMGSVFRVPFVYVDDLEEAVLQMKQKSIRIFAAHLSGETYYDSFSYREGTAFLIGNEGKGLSAGLTELADDLLRIPMEGKVESLNAAVAAALLLYEAHRQRRHG